MDNCCRPHPEKQGAMDGQAQLSTSPRIRAKRIFKEKEGAKRKSAKPPQATARLSFAALQDRRALPLSYVKNNVVTQDGPPCSGLSADMIGLRPHHLPRAPETHPVLLHCLWPTLGASRPRFLSGAVGLPVPLLQSPTLARRRRL